MKRLIESIRQVISEAEMEKEQCASHRIILDKKVISVLILFPFCLTMIYYLSDYDFTRQALLNIGITGFVKWMDGIIYYSVSSNLGKLSYWGFILFFFYFIIPAIVIKFFFKQKLSEYGLKLGGAFKGYGLYILILLFMIPLVLYFSGTSSFQDKYPFLKLQQGDNLYPDFWKWEIVYCAQFFALEFFFRGFILFGLKPKLGFYSIFVMTVPYCMIHFGKPMPETIAAIIAGIALGWLSLKNKSIWLGFLIHCSVGLSMDLASLWQKGFFD